MKKVWMRVGVSVEVSDEQFAELRDMSTAGNANYRDIDVPDWLIDLAQNNGEIDGDAYIPGDVISELDQNDDSCATTREKIEELKNVLSELLNKGTSIKDCVGYIYGLFQNYQLSEDQEVELYMFVDPDELWNSPSEYWNGQDENPLIDYLNKMERK